MHHFIYKDNELYCESVAIADIAKSPYEPMELYDPKVQQVSLEDKIAYAREIELKAKKFDKRIHKAAGIYYNERIYGQ